MYECNKEICTFSQINSIYICIHIFLNWLYACNKQIKFHIMIVKLAFGTLIGEKIHTHTHSKENNNFWIVWHFSEPEIESSPMIIKIQYIHYHSPASIIIFFFPPSLFLFSSFQSEWLLFYFIFSQLSNEEAFYVCFMYIMCICVNVSMYTWNI